jgi:DNA polymerase IV
MTPRKIVHIDMDAFYASVEQRDDPTLRGRPVVVAWRGLRSVVCAASYEARKFGVRSAMPAVRAERLCPDAVFVPPDFVRYKIASQHIREIFSRHTDMIEPLSLDEAYLDVTENKCHLSSATEVASRIRESIFEETQLTASAGIAPNKFIAKIASDWNKPNGQFVVRPQEVLDFLTPLPVGRLPGVGKVMEAKLAALNIQTVGQLRQLPENRVVSERPTQQISSEDTFQTDLGLEAIDDAIVTLTKKTWAAFLREPQRIPRTVVLKLKTSDFQTLTRSITPQMPPNTELELLELALQLKQRVDLPETTRFRLVGVGLSNFMDAAQSSTQAQLFE